ncbi:MAG: barstar family protein [Lachnospiraceae bacterium]|nr:barstar family protein [Lachnospiraceae bacterium]
MIKKKNRIICIGQKNADKILLNLRNDPNIFCVEIEGENCKVLSDYLTEVSTKFQFPILSEGYDGYADWICDLTWIREENIAIVIKNYGEFLCEEQYEKQTVVDIFEKLVFPWWESEVCEHVVEGKPRSFIVYLVI